MSRQSPGVLVDQRVHRFVTMSYLVGRTTLTQNAAYGTFPAEAFDSFYHGPPNTYHQRDACLNPLLSSDWASTMPLESLPYQYGWGHAISTATPSLQPAGIPETRSSAAAGYALTCYSDWAVGTQGADDGDCGFVSNRNCLTSENRFPENVENQRHGLTSVARAPVDSVSSGINGDTTEVKGELTNLEMPHPVIDRQV